MPEPEATQAMGLGDAIATLVSELPKPVQNFVTGPKRDEVSRTLTQKYQLHLDQGAAFERAYLMMLLGAESPVECAADLKEAGITEPVIASLMNDLNDLVFLPLQKEIRTADENVAATTTAPRAPAQPPRQELEIAPHPLPALQPAPSIIGVVSAPTPPTVAVPHTSTPLTASAPVAPVPVPTSRPAPVQVSMNSQSFSHPAAVPMMHTMAADIEAVKEHRPAEMRHPVMHPSAPASFSMPPTPEVPPMPMVAAPPMPPRSMPAPPPNLPGAPAVTSYKTDPYRESFE